MLSFKVKFKKNYDRPYIKMNIQLAYQSNCFLPFTVFKAQDNCLSVTLCYQHSK